MYKIISAKLPPYLYVTIPPLQKSHRYPGCFRTLCCRTTLFQYSFLPFTTAEWNKLYYDIKNIDSHAMFLKKVLIFIRLLEKHTYEIYDPLGIILLNSLRLGFSHLRKNKFRHNFADTLNASCSCSLEAEGTEYPFLRYQNNLSLRTTLMNGLNSINTAIVSLNQNDLLIVILYGDKSFNKETNCKILITSVKFVRDNNVLKNFSFNVCKLSFSYYR